MWGPVAITNYLTYNTMADNFNVFWSIVDNYLNGNIEDYKKSLNKLGKTRLVQFFTWLEFNYPRLKVCVNGFGVIIISEK